MLNKWTSLQNKKEAAITCTCIVNDRKKLISQNTGGDIVKFNVHKCKRTIITIKIIRLICSVLAALSCQVVNILNL